MALPTLDATFASSADLPRKQMLAKWLVEELGETQAPSDVLVSGLVIPNANGLYVRNGNLNGKAAYFLNGTNTGNAQSFIAWNGSIWVIEEQEYGGLFTSDESVTYPWLVTSWTQIAGNGSLIITESPAPSPLSNYYSLPERYLWAKIAVAAGGPKTEADYISLPKNYVWSDIYNAVAGLISPSDVLVSGAGSSDINGTYTYRGEVDGKPYYNLSGQPNDTSEGVLRWLEDLQIWVIRDGDGNPDYTSSDSVEFPWQASWEILDGGEPFPTFTEVPQPTPNHTDWSENVALGHIAAAYRGDTGNPANLATYIDWPWRYKVASVIQAL